MKQMKMGQIVCVCVSVCGLAVVKNLRVYFQSKSNG